MDLIRHEFTDKAFKYAHHEKLIDAISKRLSPEENPWKSLGEDKECVDEMKQRLKRIVETN